MRIEDRQAFCERNLYEIDVGALSRDDWAAVIRRADAWARVERSRRFTAMLRRLVRIRRRQRPNAAGLALAKAAKLR